MTLDRGREVYIFFEGVFELDESVEPRSSSSVTVRTPWGARLSLPIEAVAEWDVHTPIGGYNTTGLVLESTLPNRSTPRPASAAPSRRLRRA